MRGIILKELGNTTLLDSVESTGGKIDMSHVLNQYNGGNRKNRNNCNPKQL